MAATTELRVELPTEDLSVLDGYCAGTHQDRTKVLRRILAEWSAAKLHEATLICRMSRVNPLASESDRK